MEEIDNQSLPEEENAAFEEENAAFEKMSDAYGVCEDFGESVSIPHQGRLTDEQKQEEERLNDEHEKSIQEFLDACSKRKNLRNKK